MPDSFEFEVRPLQGATAAVDEEVSFREDGGRLLALNEDGEPFWQRSLGINGRKLDMYVKESE